MEAYGIKKYFVMMIQQVAIIGYPGDINIKKTL